MRCDCGCDRYAEEMCDIPDTSLDSIKWDDFGVVNRVKNSSVQGKDSADQISL
jgi:hypothetical protein